MSLAFAQPTLLVLLLILASNVFAAQGVIFHVQNDAFSVNNRDRHLTNSITFGIQLDHIPELFSGILSDADIETIIATVTQDMYTPEDIGNTELIETDRPYAGHLYLTLYFIKETENTSTLLSIQAGVIGPASGAGKTQIAFHDLIDAQEPRGWDHQLNNEPTLNITLLKGIKNEVFNNAKLYSIQSISYASASFGNVSIKGTIGQAFRLGYNVPDDILGTNYDDPNDDISLYLETQFETSYIARDIFLDGNTFSNSHSVDKKSIVGSAQVGVTARWKNIHISYFICNKSEQFKGQKGSNNGGVLLIQYKTRF